MYNFLIAVGILLIILGLYYDRTVRLNKDEPLNTEVNNQESKKLDIYIDEPYIAEAEAEDKIDIIVDEPLYNFIDKEEISFEEVLESIEVDDIDIEHNEDIITSNDNETFNIMRKYEAGEYTLEEVCNILNMKKGEVLLLRNIYKKSQE
ncbi:hypothetical protein [Tissierella sp. Yu-01]|uniref:hypothetical protein n=1 Tax=Tissierella sp. Yu-01 TaxID=3035694 RepID=UPI00240DF47A|nr:hypothetical protein [Tissierella sp. Yu-01]WFA07878.1 hypothetical protein P3962_09045 [Tissierella sp. Yu-01]